LLVPHDEVFGDGLVIVADVLVVESWTQCAVRTFPPLWSLG
jgi:hypothetical protein